jgi:hypothetical protein
VAGCAARIALLRTIVGANNKGLWQAASPCGVYLVIRYQADVGKCRKEAYGDGPIPANTFLVISALAIPGMLLEIDVTAVVAK